MTITLRYPAYILYQNRTKTNRSCSSHFIYYISRRNTFDRFCATQPLPIFCICDTNSFRAFGGKFVRFQNRRNSSVDQCSRFLQTVSVNNHSSHGILPFFHSRTSISRLDIAFSFLLLEALAGCVITSLQLSRKMKLVISRVKVTSVVVCRMNVDLSRKAKRAGE
ncbi:unnamed protein product [Albugo candida]|uniref:Uncharacterized protein n=1 Tax=Albugo candida TaxID=65357 RepID=A0A024GVG9_9STRA|nr:unnamed protein product [Albugo candida]|eukprot:CCI50615.1 unnamed protein product [Albugo candida]